ncbi:hypothetical protein ACFPVX_20215 [Cohnella faecalis]|uniref:Uncharacterized protein n=1 Tax=Cohnella faecalis TaxID=2315694 RepID=A0A398CPX3_9BACL|nr:hypothetical protein [Cohnella faecalis]RIE04240.1 hypothetical protein D3H35_06385 [Cohnella faecalis]
MERKYGIDMNMPEGKLDGYYAQIVKAIAERVTLFDSHKELIVLDSPDSLPIVEELLNGCKVDHERVELVRLPEYGARPGPLFEDYAIAARSGNVFLDLSQAAFFSLREKKPEAETAPAILQLHEHLIVDTTLGQGLTVFAIDSQLAELAERIAGAYGCEAEWLETDAL